MTAPAVLNAFADIRTRVNGLIRKGLTPNEARQALGLVAEGIAVTQEREQHEARRSAADPKA